MYYNGALDEEIRILYENGMRPLHIWRQLKETHTAVPSLQTVYNKVGSFRPETKESYEKARLKERLRKLIDEV